VAPAWYFIADTQCWRGVHAMTPASTRSGNSPATCRLSITDVYRKFFASYYSTAATHHEQQCVPVTVAAYTRDDEQQHLKQQPSACNPNWLAELLQQITRPCCAEASS